MTIANDFLEQSAVEGTCETLWDRVLRMCDEWLPYEPKSVRGIVRDQNESFGDLVRHS